MKICQCYANGVLTWISDGKPVNKKYSQIKSPEITNQGTLGKWTGYGFCPKPDTTPDTKSEYSDTVPKKGSSKGKGKTKPSSSYSNQEETTDMMAEKVDEEDETTF